MVFYIADYFDLCTSVVQVWQCEELTGSNEKKFSRRKRQGKKSSGCIDLLISSAYICFQEGEKKITKRVLLKTDEVNKLFS